MKKMLRTTLTILAIGLPALVALGEDAVRTEGAQVGQWTMDYSAAAKLAREKNLPMMLNFTGSDWCGWCKLMDKGVFAKKEWKTYASKNVVLVTVDFPNDKKIVPSKYVKRNRELQERFGVEGYPTYIVLDSDGKMVLGKLGAGRGKTPASFIEEFKQVAKLSSANVAAFAKANPGKGAELKKAIADYKAAVTSLEGWIETGPARNEANDKKYDALVKRIVDARGVLGKFDL